MVIEIFEKDEIPLFLPNLTFLFYTLDDRLSGLIA